MITLHKTTKYNERKPAGTLPRYIIIHGTEVDEAESLAILTGEHEHEASAHYMIAEDGRVFYLVDEKYRAWHAGKSFWEGNDDINSLSIGIELVAVSADKTFGDVFYTEAQISALAELVSGIKERHNISDYHVLAHQDVAPGRKKDPGINFPWNKLAEKGIGVWPAVCNEPWNDTPLDAGGQNEFWSGMVGYGYDTRDLTDEKSAEVLLAFRLHFASVTAVKSGAAPTIGDRKILSALLEIKRTK